MRITDMAIITIFIIFTACNVYAQENKDIIPDDVTFEEIATGFEFTEGPYWQESGVLLFSDIPANIIYQWTEDDGVSIWKKPSGHSNGITKDLHGNILLAQHDRRVSKIQPDGEEVPLAKRYQGKKLNSPNDIIVSKQGIVYFTDPPFGIDKQQKELSSNGVYKLDASGLTLLADDFERPNGLALSPDEQTLYVDDSFRAHIKAFDVKEDGMLENERIFAKMEDEEREGLPDGMKVDIHGNVYATGAGGIWVFTPEGELIDRILTPKVATNLVWGGKDLNTLFVTAQESVYKITLNTTGLKQR